MCRGARFGSRDRALGASGLILIMLSFAARATQCPQDSPPTSARSSPSRLTAAALINAATVVCRRPATAEAAQSRSPAPKLDYASLRDVESSRIADATSDTQTARESRFGVRWRAVIGPEWVRNVPQWVIDDARNYKHRGLPVVHLWQSNQYQVALGLSNRGVPGVYFSQKLP